jgi:hypothetical protein
VKVLPYGALLISLAALALSIVALRAAGRPGAEPVATDVATSNSDDLRQEVARLRAEVTEMTLRARSPAPGQRSAATPAGDPAASAGDRSRVPGGQESRRYVRFDAPSGVVLNDSGNGVLSVTNQDPSLTGKMLLVKGVRDDGSEETLRIVVPAPGK